MELTSLEKKLINGWQKGFPIVAHPFAHIADDLGISEQNVLEILADLKSRGLLSRVGAVVRPNTVGCSSLVAMAVPPEQLEKVAEIVDDIPQVNHNYERENELNLWFVVSAESSNQLDQILTYIKERTGFDTVKLPLEKAYHIDLGFSI